MTTPYLPLQRHLYMERLLVAFQFVWGLILVMPWNTFAASPKAWKVFIESGIPEWGWGLSAIVMAVCYIVILMEGNHIARMWMAFLQMIGWVALTAAALGSNPLGVSWGFYAILAVACGWLFVRLGGGRIWI